MTDVDWNASLDIYQPWFTLPLTSEDELTDLQAQVDARIEHEPELATHRDELLHVLATFVEDQRANGALSACVRVDYSEIFGSSVASMSTFVYDRGDDGPVEAEIAALRAGLAERQATDQGAREVEVRQLPAGDAVRLRYMTLSDLPNGGEGEALILETLQYFLPVPGHPETFQLAFVTTDLAGADELVAEFDVMAASVELEL